jgi:ferredoxin
MMAAIVTTLHTIGVPSSQIYQESFVRATPSASGEPSSKRAIDHPGSGSVTFQTSQKTKALSAGQTILDAAVELGVDMTYDCRVGICGQCKTRLISGSVVMEVQDALSSADEVNGLILSCQARCLDEVVVEA